MSLSFRRQVAFITGASRSIGATVARSQARACGSGAGLDLPDALGLVCDVRDRSWVERTVAATIERFGRLDICIANAGVGSYRSLVETPLERLILLAPRSRRREERDQQASAGSPLRRLRDETERISIAANQIS